MVKGKWRVIEEYYHENGLHLIEQRNGMTGKREFRVRRVKDDGVLVRVGSASKSLVSLRRKHDLEI